MARYDGDPLDWPRVEWATFMNRMSSWKQGRHLIVIGETDSGKTTLISKLVERAPVANARGEQFIIVFVTKTYDKSFSQARWPGFTRMKTWSMKDAARHKKVLLWPTPGKTIVETVERQIEVFQKALNEIYLDRGWTLVIDELHWMITQLKMRLEMETFQHQARSSGITMISGFQRPANVPVITYGSSQDVLCSRQREVDDVKRLAELMGTEVDKIRAALPLLRKHDWLYGGPAATTGAFLTRVNL